MKFYGCNEAAEDNWHEGPDGFIWKTRELENRINKLERKIEELEADAAAGYHRLRGRIDKLERLQSIKHRTDVIVAESFAKVLLQKTILNVIEELFIKLCKENPEAISDAVSVAIQRGNPALLNAVRSA